MEALRRLDIGIASYKAPEKLDWTISAVKQLSVTDWRLFVIHNPSEGDGATLAVIDKYRDPRIVLVQLPENIGYAGAVNKLFELAETEYVAYLDNDAYVRTPGWDEQMCGILDRFHEVGMVFPNGGAYLINRPGYCEVMWAPGFAWVLSRMAQRATGELDVSLGHQEEADYCQRLRMAGFRCAAATAVQVRHDATATNDPASLERINRGVVRWVDKWNRYFNGANFSYHSPNVTRFEDWPPNALYLEDYWREKLPGLNASPETVTVDNRTLDLIRVPRWPGMYVNRYV